MYVWHSILKSRDITLLTKVCIVNAMVFPVVMSGCEGWTINKAEHWGIDAFELWCWRKLLRVPWTARRSWIFIGRTDAEAPILWPPEVKNWLIRKDSDTGKDWRQKKKGMTEDEMVGWHYRLDGHEVEQALGVGDGQGSLACCSPRGRRELDNWTTVVVQLSNWKTTTTDPPCTFLRIKRGGWRWGQKSLSDSLSLMLKVKFKLAR